MKSAGCPVLSGPGLPEHEGLNLATLRGDVMKRELGGIWSGGAGGEV